MRVSRKWSEEGTRERRVVVADGEKKKNHLSLSFLFTSIDPDLQRVTALWRFKVLSYPLHLSAFVHCIEIATRSILKQEMQQ